ncbi:long-chain fatty acid transporter [Aurantimonas sp. A2-1-M11]|uniref:long-chain fatty acid transporter n=1 Tax=Aurantimonas sp. A2-1-M11 TaxID=3113712 RepID=UPI002F934115
MVEVCRGSTSGGIPLRTILTTILGASLASAALGSSALAGGFQRGTADTDILYEAGTASMRFGMTYVNPQRGFESIDGQSGDFSTYTQDYAIPSLAFAINSEMAGCAGTYTISFAAESDYRGSPGDALPAGPTAGSRTETSEFESNEFGLTCRLSYTNDIGRFSMLGGVFVEDFTFDGTSLSTTPLPVRATVETESGYATGYRIGAAFEKPEIALRAQILYRSEVKHDSFSGTGQVATTTDVLFPIGTVIQQGTSGFSDVVSPQSLYINAQTGIAPGTLLLASFRWTDWSTNGVAASSITTGGVTRSSLSPYNWRDGYTASIGLGRAFNEQISGAVSLGYDRGVSTGSETTYTDLYTLAGGVSFKANEWSELRFGGLVGYWTDGEQSVSDGAYFDATVGDDFVYAVNASMKFTF